MLQAPEQRARQSTHLPACKRTRKQVDAVLARGRCPKDGSFCFGRKAVYPGCWPTMSACPRNPAIASNCGKHAYPALQARRWIGYRAQGAVEGLLVGRVRPGFARLWVSAAGRAGPVPCPAGPTGQSFNAPGLFRPTTRAAVIQSARQGLAALLTLISLQCGELSRGWISMAICTRDRP